MILMATPTMIARLPALLHEDSVTMRAPQNIQKTLQICRHLRFRRLGHRRQQCLRFRRVVLVTKGSSTLTEDEEHQSVFYASRGFRQGLFGALQGNEENGTMSSAILIARCRGACPGSGFSQRFRSSLRRRSMVRSSWLLRESCCGHRICYRRRSDGDWRPVWRSDGLRSVTA